MKIYLADINTYSFRTEYFLLALKMAKMLTFAFMVAKENSINYVSILWTEGKTDKPEEHHFDIVNVYPVEIIKCAGIL